MNRTNSLGWAFILLLIVVQSPIAMAQVSKFGQITKEELQMDAYDMDSSAAAVVLFEYGDVIYNSNYTVEMDYHVRIKIFTQEGYDWATDEIIYNKDFQSVKKIKGFTYYLDENDEIQKVKLDKKSIYDEKFNGDIRSKKFTMPAITEGAVIEYSYKKILGNANFLPDWDFQRSIPVMWSEFEALIPFHFVYLLTYRGYIPLEVNTKEKARWTADVQGTKHRWVLKDVPALTDLPFVSSLENYRCKIRTQLAKVYFPGMAPQDILGNWGNILEQLNDHEDFGEEFSKNKFKDKVTELVTEDMSEMDKAQTIFNYVAGNFEWDGRHRIFVSQNLKKVNQSKHGTSADINLLLTQMLRDAGLDANPVLVSTQNNGKVNYNLPLVNQFNHVISAVEIDSTYYPMDATGLPRPITLLPIKDINNIGFVVKDKSMDWVDLMPMQKTIDVVNVNAIIDESGSITGTYNFSAKGYAAYDLRSDYQDYENDEEFVSDHWVSNEDVIIENIEINEDQENRQSFKAQFSFEQDRSTDVKAVGGYIYLNPLILLQKLENPFPEPVRYLPVEFPYAFDKQYTATITIPDGYTIDEFPRSILSRLPSRKANMKRMVQVDGNKVTILLSRRIHDNLFNPDEYADLREFYRQFVDLQEDRIVLKKVSDSR